MGDTIVAVSEETSTIVQGDSEQVADAQDYLKRVSHPVPVDDADDDCKAERSPDKLVLVSTYSKRAISLEA